MVKDVAYTDELLFGIGAANSEKKQKPVYTTGNTLGFESYLDTERAKESNKSSTVDLADKNKPAERKTERKPNRSESQDQQRFRKKATDNNSAQKERNPKVESSSNSANEVTETSDAKMSSGASTAKREKAQDVSTAHAETELNEEGALAKIAELLGKPTEDVMAILSAMNLNIQDLSNSENLINFIKDALAVTDASGLLEVPNFKDLYVGIRDVLTEMQTETSTEMPASMMQAVETDVEAPLESAVDKTAGSVKESAGIIHDSGVNDSIRESSEQLGMQTTQEATQQTVAQNISSTTGSAEETADEALIEMLETNQSATVTEVLIETSLTSNGASTGEQKNDTSQDPQNLYDTDESGFIQGGIQLSPESMASLRETQARSLSALRSSGIDSQDVINQVVEKLKVEVRANISEIRLTLRPESLGEVSLKISMENGLITAQFTAENQRVKALLESNFNQLKDALQQQGLNVAELYVSVGQDSSQEKMDMFNMSRRKNSERIKQIMGSIIEEEEEMEPGAGEAIVDVLA